MNRDHIYTRLCIFYDALHGVIMLGSSPESKTLCVCKQAFPVGLGVKLTEGSAEAFSLISGAWRHVEDRVNSCFFWTDLFSTSVWVQISAFISYGELMCDCLIFFWAVFIRGGRESLGTSQSDSKTILDVYFFHQLWISHFFVHFYVRQI